MLFRSADDKSGTVLEKVRLGLKGIDSGAKRAGKSSHSLKTSWMAAAAAATALVAVIGKIEAAYAVQERVERRLQFALKAQGLEVKKNKAHLLAYASALQQVSTSGDETIIPLQQLLIQLGHLTGKKLDRATALTLDFASAMGIDLRSAAVLVAKAAGGNVSALTRYGVMVDKSIPKTKQFAAVLDQLQEKFGGTAQSDVGTFSGQLAQLKNNMGDLMEQIGGRNAGILTTSIRTWNKWALTAVNAIKRVNAAEGILSIAESLRIEITKDEEQLKKLNKTEEELVRILNTGAPGAELYTRALKDLRKQQNQILADITKNKKILKSGANLGEPSEKPSPAVTLPPIVSDTARIAQIQAQLDSEQSLLVTGSEAWLAIQQTRMDLELDMERAKEAAKKQLWLAGLAERENIAAAEVAVDRKVQAAKISAMDSVLTAMSGFEGTQKAAFIIQRGIAAAQAYIHGSAASIAALAPPPIGLGPVAGIALAAKIRLLTAINVAGILATTIGRLSGGGSRSGSGGSSSYSYSGAAAGTAGSSSPEPAPGPVNVIVNVMGGTKVMTPEEQAEISIKSLEQYLMETGNKIGSITLQTV